MVHKITELVDENTYVRVTQYMVASVFFPSTCLVIDRTQR
jgi:hypothetical protein